MYSLAYSRNFQDGEGDCYVSIPLILISRNIIVSYSELPQTWEYFGRIFKIEDITGIGQVITDEAVLRPNYPNLLHWSQPTGFRLAIRLVKYIKKGKLDIYHSI
jgi:hypothetical protein